MQELLGLPGQLELPRAKGHHREDRRHYSEILTGRDKAIIALLFAEEIQRFGYTF